MFSPRPPPPKLPADTLRPLGPSPLSWRPPTLPWDFQWKPDPPFLAPRTFPLPRAETKKKYQNVHQVKMFPVGASWLLGSLHRFKNSFGRYVTGAAVTCNYGLLCRNAFVTILNIRANAVSPAKVEGTCPNTSDVVDVLPVFKILGRTFTRLTRVSLVTRVWRRFFFWAFSASNTGK